MMPDSEIPAIEDMTHREQVRLGDISDRPGRYRPLEPRFVEAIVASWDGRKLTAPLLVESGEKGSLFILNGQHRVAAAKVVLGSDAIIWADVVRGPFAPRVAELFK